jgi:hypothetical protein
VLHAPFSVDITVRKIQLNSRMNFSTLLHSNLVNPAKPAKIKENDRDVADRVTMDIPLLVRVLELSRENLKSDADLHVVVTRLIELKNQGVLTMNNYEQIANGFDKGDAPTQQVDAELESIKKLAGI